MTIRNAIRAGLVAAMLAGGAIMLPAAPAQAMPVRCDAEDAERQRALFAQMMYWWDRAQWLEANGGSNAQIETAYYNYMVADDALTNAERFCG